LKIFLQNIFGHKMMFEPGIENGFPLARGWQSRHASLPLPAGLGLDILRRAILIFL